MSFDGLFTHSMILELKEKIMGGRISKVYQPYDNEIIIRIRANRQNYDLLLSAHPQYARMQLTNISFNNPQEPPHFCMILRKYLENGFLQSIEQIGNDRIVELHVSSRNELGDEQDIVLVVEIMGRHSNLILVDRNNDRIIHSVKPIPPSQNAYRTILPGVSYIQAPRQEEKTNPFEFTRVNELIGESLDVTTKRIQTQLEGFAKQSAKELAYRLMHTDNTKYDRVYHSFIQACHLENLKPTLYKSNGKEKFAPFPYETLDGTIKQFNTLSELLDRYYDQKAERDRVHQLASDLYSIVNNELTKNKKKLVKMNRDLEETKLTESYRIQGEVLTAYLHLVEQGMTEITLTNFYDNEKITIELDPQKSPADNAQYYFSRYQKMKKRKAHLTKQIKITNMEINYLESVLTQLDVVSLDDIEEIRDELRSEGYIKSKSKSKKRSKSKKSKPYHFRSTDGEDILVGRNNTQNDELTMRKANRTDWWLHTQNIPGSHVIIRSDNPSEQTFLEAAHIAAYFSKSRESASVPVDTVQVKHINKPNGAKPGFVTYEGQNTYFVTPTKSLIDKLKVD